MSLTKDQMNLYRRAVSQSQSNYAIKNFVNGGQLTPWRRFRQAIIELDVAERNMAELKFTLDGLHVDRDEAEEKLMEAEKNDPSGYEARRQRIALAKIGFAIEGIDRSMEAQAREMQAHLTLLNQYKDELHIPDDISLDELYQRFQDSEGEYYRTKLALDISAQLVQAKGGPQMGVLLALQQLEPEDLERVGAIISVMLPKMMTNEYTPELHSPSGMLPLEQTALDALKAPSKEEATPPTQTPSGFEIPEGSSFQPGSVLNVG